LVAVRQIRPFNSSASKTSTITLDNASEIFVKPDPP
jgi:hypothetical protein